MPFRRLSRSRLVLVLAACASVLATPFASGQAMTAVTGFHVDTGPLASARNPSLVASAQVNGVANARIAVSGGCWQNPMMAYVFAGQVLSGDSYSFDLSLEGASFDTFKNSAVSSTDAFGHISIQGRTRNQLAFQGRLDAQEPFRDEYWGDNADHTFRADFPPSQLAASSHLILAATSGGRTIAVKIDLKEPVLAQAIGRCQALEQARADKLKAEVDADKAERDAVKERVEHDAAKSAEELREEELEHQRQLAYLGTITLKGSVDEVVAKLPAMFAARAAELGDPPGSYASQIAQIARLLRACSDGSGGTPGCNLPVHDFFAELPDDGPPGFRHVWIGWSLHGGAFMFGPDVNGAKPEAHPAYFSLQAGLGQRVDGQAQFHDLSPEQIFRRQAVFRAYIPYAPAYSDRLGQVVIEAQRKAALNSPRAVPRPVVHTPRLDALVVFLGLGDVPAGAIVEDPLSPAKAAMGVHVEVRADTPDFAYSSSQVDYRKLDPPGGIDPSIEDRTPSASLIAGEVVRAGTKCEILMAAHPARMISGKKYVEVRCPAVLPARSKGPLRGNEASFVPVESIAYDPGWNAIR